MLTSSAEDVPALMSPEPPMLSETGPSVLAMFQAPQPALPNSTDVGSAAHRAEDGARRVDVHVPRGADDDQRRFRDLIRP